MENNKLTTTFKIDFDRVTLTFTTENGYLSFTGKRAGSCEQILDSIPACPGQECGEELAEVLDLWRNHHLKLCPVDALDDFAENVSLLFSALDGAHFWHAESFPVVEVPDADFDQYADTIDSRDIIARIEELEACENLPEDRKTELDDLRKLESECEGYCDDWQFGATLIRGSYFKDYAQEFADDCGLLKEGSQWPYTCIDWDQAARELQIEYTRVEWRGVTYWIR